MHCCLAYSNVDAEGVGYIVFIGNIIDFNRVGCLPKPVKVKCLIGH